MTRYILIALLFIFFTACNSDTERNANNTDSLVGSSDKTLKKVEPIQVHDISEIIKNPLTAVKDKKQAAEGKIPTLDFDNLVYDFGVVSPGDSIIHNFIFKNNGNGPLIIHEARSTCGCTIPSYPKEFLPVGTKDTVKVIFNTENKMGKQVKEIRIFANTIPKETILTFVGVVDPR